VLVSWLPAYIAGQVREAWADSAPVPAATAVAAGVPEATQETVESAGPAVAAFAPPATSE
jgi:hypothetical protein